MLWSTAAAREDYSDDSDTPDDDQGRGRSSRSSRRDHRHNTSSASAMWFPFSLFAPSPSRKSSARPGSRRAISPTSRARKSRRRDKVGALLKQRASRRPGLIFLAVLLLLYVSNFFYHTTSRHRSPYNNASFLNRRSVARPPPYTPPQHHAAKAAPPVRPPPPFVPHPNHLAQQVTKPAPYNPPPYAPAANRRAQPYSDELAVPANTGTLEPDAVRSHYRRLAKHYLKTFTGGIYRQLFFDVLRRRTYALTPPGANKGVQCILFQIINKRVYMMDPYEVPRNSKPFYRTRINEVIWILSKLAEEGRIRDTEFLMAIHDCVQTVNKPHSYRGAHYQESNPTFTIVTCNFSNNIPFPMWEGADRDGGFLGWDTYTGTYAADTTSWADKKAAAVFRGSNRPSMYFRNKEDADSHCDRVGRTRLIYLQRINPGLFDVSVGGSCGGNHHTLQRLTPHEHHRYKYIMYMEGNCGWADRLRHQIFGPSAIIKQDTPCKQFFEPLMAPMTHYIPTDFFLGDTVSQIHWARDNDGTVRNIVRNANEFAGNFLTRRGIETYVEVLLDEYTKLLVEPDIRLENGAVEVTHKKV